MSDQRKQARGRAHLLTRNNVLAVAIFIALTGTAVAAPGGPKSSSGGPQASASVVTGKKFKKLKRMVAGLSARLAALEGKPPVTTASPTGLAGGALTGAYPNPLLNVSGGPCPNGQELDNVSALAALRCSPGVYSDASENVAAGPDAFPALSGSFGLNTAVGSDALLALTDGNNNSAFGTDALTDNNTGDQNTAVGSEALGNNKDGFENVAVGEGALQGMADGDANTALGDDAMQGSSTVHNDNTAVGEAAIQQADGSNNTALGEGAGSGLGSGTPSSNNILIGADVTGTSNDLDTTRIGSAQTRAFIAGIHGVTTGGAAIPALIDANGQLGTTSSSRRVKRDIQPLGATDRLMSLRPVSFRYREGPPELHYGLLAEQVARVLPELAVYGEDGLPETVQYQELPVLLLAKIQSQQRQIKGQQAQVRRQQAQIDWLIRRARGR